MKVAIITEGLSGTGYGHLTRCLSVYEAFEEKNIIPLYVANCDEGGKVFLPNVNLLQLDWLNKKNELLQVLENFDIAIIDSYLAPFEIYENIQSKIKKVVYIDDFLRLDYPEGIILNGTIGAESLPYRKKAGQDYLLGIDYMPMRKEFWDVELNKKMSNEVKNILLTFGGQDVNGLTYNILNTLIDRYPNLNYHIIKGSLSNNSRNEEKYSSNVKFYFSLSAKKILELMLDTDIAITACGQTTYELARVGVPSIGIATADNQKYNLEGWYKVGFFKEEIWYNDNYTNNVLCLFSEYLTTNIEKISYCDGQGVRRIIKALL